MTPRPNSTVAFIAHDIHRRGGMERAFAELIRRLAQDYRVVVISCTLEEELRPLVDWRRVRTPARPFPLKFCWFFLASGIHRRFVAADLVHVLGAITPARADIACVQFCHAAYIHAAGRYSPPDAPLARRLNSGAARFLAVQAERWCYKPDRLHLFGAVSSGVAAELRSWYPDVRVELTPNGVDLQQYRANDATRRRLRRVKLTPRDTFVVLFVGGDWDRKGLSYAIAALAIARTCGVPGVLWVVGRGETRRFECLAAREGVADFVTFFGPQSATHEYFQAADIFVLPTLYETFSLVAYEAAATGLPIVATAVSGITDLLTAGAAGILVERDSADIASAIVTLWKDDSLRAQLGATGRARASNYGWDKAATAVTDLYLDILNRRRSSEHCSMARKDRTAIVLHMQHLMRQDVT